MRNTIAIENNLLDAVTAVVMFPINLIHLLLWLIWRVAGSVWPYRWYIGLVAVLATAVVVCVAVPLLPVGLAITAAVGWVTMPRDRRCA